VKELCLCARALGLFASSFLLRRVVFVWFGSLFLLLSGLLALLCFAWCVSCFFLGCSLLREVFASAFCAQPVHSLCGPSPGPPFVR